MSSKGQNKKWDSNKGAGATGAARESHQVISVVEEEVH